MDHSPVLGLVMVVLGGFFQALFMLPAKWCRNWKFEHLWLGFSLFCYFLIPWLIVLFCVPDIAGVIRATPPHTLLMMAVYASGWALAALGFGIGVSAIGLSLGFAIIFGLAAFVGALVPLLASTSGSTLKFVVILSCLVLMLIGVGLCSFAGRWREQQTMLDRSHYLRGVIFCICSGLLGAAGNLAFGAGAGMAEVGLARGLSSFAASSLVLACLCLFMFLFNGGYAVILLIRNASFPLLGRGNLHYFAFSAAMGLIWMASFLLYGMGSAKLGKLGLSLGWGVFMCTVVASANIVGIFSGEWRKAPARAMRQLAVGLVMLMFAIAGLAASNAMA
jgi:L-rhamnose-H+ transport protein